MGDQPVARLLPTQNSMTQKDEDKYPCLEWDLNPRSQCPDGQDPSPRQYSNLYQPVNLV
jgi:hypothetical protein